MVKAGLRSAQKQEAGNTLHLLKKDLLSHVPKGPVLREECTHQPKQTINTLGETSALQAVRVRWLLPKTST